MALNKKICFLLIAFSIDTQASMRCSDGIISEGDTIFEVQNKCGKPVNKEIINPITNLNGIPLKGSVTIEDWVYENSGMFYFLRFIDNKLERINSRRM